MTVPDWVIRELGLDSIAPAPSTPMVTVEELDNIHVLYLEDIIYSKYTTESGDDIDLVAVERAIEGRPVRLTRAELTYTVRTMASMKLSDREIGERLGKTANAVCMIRVRNNIPAGIEATQRTVQRKRAAA